VFGPVYGDEYAIEFKFNTNDELNTYWPAVQQLNQSGSVLLLQFPDGHQVWGTMGPGAAGTNTEETYNSLPGDPTVTQWRRWKLVFTETGPPDYY
jgi:hypothetical protein